VLAAAPVRSIRLTKLRPGVNPRGAKRPDVRDLLASFERTPLLQNIVVRRLPGPRDEYEVIAGHRRFEAAKREGWSHIEAKVIEASDHHAEIIALEENLRRKALPDEPAAMARLLALYAAEGARRRGGDRRSARFKASNDHGGRSVESAAGAAARLTGKSQTAARRAGRIGRKATPEVLDALASREITTNEADALVRLPAAEQRRALARTLREKRRREDEASEVPKDVRRAIDGLDHALKVLGGLRRGEVDAATVAGMKERVAALTAAVDRLGGRGKVASPAPAAVAKADPAGAVRFEPTSMNRKLGPVAQSPGKARPHFAAMPPYVASTLVSIQATCPSFCAFKGSPTEPGGCYADAGFTRIAMQKLDAAAWGCSSVDVIREEARQIDDAFDGGPVPQDGARGGRDLRLHVGGDVDSAEGARVLARAARRWRARGGGAVWTYTHAWKDVPRSAWGEAITVLASVEKVDEIEKAQKRGYACAVVVEEFPAGDKAWTVGRTRIVPCPAETRGTTCAECRLCLDRDLHAQRTAVAFKLHGLHADAARAAMSA
jgi:ParB-like chromosome segregation protein Spo0J